MNIIFKIAMFGVFLNFGIGITMLALPEYGNTCFNYNEAEANSINSTFGGVIAPNNDVEDQSSSFIRLIDSLNLGVIGKILDGFNTFLFGTVDYAACLFNARGLTGSAKTMYYAVEAMLKIMIGIGYVFGAMYLWTGRKINK